MALGIAVLDGPTLPIIAEGDEEPNDTYLQQLMAGAKAAVEVHTSLPLHLRAMLSTRSCASCLQCLHAEPCKACLSLFDFSGLVEKDLGLKNAVTQLLCMHMCQRWLVLQEVVSRGVVHRKRIAVGGHSYGAFMAANLLAADTEGLFACGIAQSGAYNRTLTPFGFQSEQRTLWEAPDIYNNMSPFLQAWQLFTTMRPSVFTLQIITLKMSTILAQRSKGRDCVALNL